MIIKKDYLISKRNILNEIRANNMTLQELRFFSIYLSKINPKDTKTKVVRFPISDFQKIMKLGSRIKIDYLKHVTNSLLCKVVNIPKETGGYESFQLFKKCVVDIDDMGEWYIEINAHDDALPLMFEFKDRYFTYQLWNALQLRSSNQLRMYEILKQYEKVGQRIISIDKLKELLGIDKNEYSRYDNFKKRVLDSCQKALILLTDIQFTYEPTGKRGKGGKILNLKFIIKKNDTYCNQLTLEDFINNQSNEDGELEIDPGFLNNKFTDKLTFLSDACKNEFNINQMQILYDLITKILPFNLLRIDTEVYDYLKRKYDELIYRSERTNIKHRFNYFKKMLEAEIYEAEIS